MNILKRASRLSKIGLNSRFFTFTYKQGNLSSFILLSSTLHTSNHPTPHTPKPYFYIDGVTNLDDAFTLFDQMLQFKHRVSISLFNKLFNVLVKLNHFSEAIVMSKKLSLLGVEFDEFTMSIVMNCYCNLEEVDLGFAVLGGMIKRGYGTDVVSITCLIKGLFLMKNVGEGVGLFRKAMRNKFCEVSVVTVSIVMDGLCKSGNVESAVELLEKLEDMDFRLNVVVYNTVIDGLCKDGKVKDAKDILFRMVDRGFLPDVVTYTSFIHGLCKLKLLDIACPLFSDLPSKGISPDVITYTVMIQGLCKEGMLREVKEVLDKMEQLGCLPNSVTYNLIIQGCLRCRGRLHYIDLFNQIIERDFQLNARTYFLALRQLRRPHHDAMISRLKQKFFPGFNRSARAHRMIHLLPPPT